MEILAQGFRASGPRPLVPGLPLVPSAPEETENHVEKPDDEGEDSEVPSLPLGLTGDYQSVFPGRFLKCHTSLDYRI